MAATVESADKDKSQMAKASDATDSARIGWAFLSQYYSYLNKDPARLHCFYTKRSTLIHSTEGEETVACYGQSEIHDKIMSLGFDDCKVYISNVDSQSSAEHGIIVQVIGEMSNSNGPWRKFAQTFFLAEQPNGYFVLNDICRYIKEEGDEELSTPAPPSGRSDAPAPAVETADDAPPASVESVLFNDVKTSAAQEPAEEVEGKEDPTVVADAAPAGKALEVTESELAQPPNGVSSTTVNGNAKELQGEEKTVAVEPLSAVEHKSNHQVASAKQEESEPAVPTVAEVKKAEQEEEAQVVEETPASAESSEPLPAEDAPAESAAQASVPSTTPQPTVSTPATAPTSSPAVPAAPKSWASLAASNSTKWGSFNKAAAAAAPKPAESSTPAPINPAVASSAAAQTPTSTTTPQFPDQVQAVAHSNCFVKGVLEYVTEKQLREVLTTRFGPLKELDIIRSKACAFVEFVNVNDARKAIQVSLRIQDGGENGIMFDVPTGEKARLNVVERKPHNERPPPKPRNPDGAGGSSAGGAKGQLKDGQQQRNQGRGPGGPRTGGRGGGARTGGGRQATTQGGQSKQ